MSLLVRDIGTVRGAVRVRRTRVAYLICSGGLGGGEMLLLNHLAHADRDAFDPLVVCATEGPLAERLGRLGVPVFILPIHRQAQALGRVRVPIPSIVWRLVQLLRREGVGLIHSYTMDSRNYAHAAGLLTACPVIHTSHDFWNQFKAIQRWVMNRIPARIIVVSETVRQSLCAGNRLDPARVALIKPGVDIGRFVPRDGQDYVRTEFGLPSDTPLVGIVGRFSAVKGFDTFLEAAALVVHQLPAARFLVVGGAVLPFDHYAEEIPRVIGRLRLHGHVILTGFRDDVPRLMAGMDVLVSASPRESYPTVLMEAAACGRPVVATRSGGGEEIVIQGETGLLVPPKNPSAMAEAIVALLTQPQQAAVMGRAARSRAEERFDLIQMVRRVETEYRAILNGHSR